MIFLLVYTIRFDHVQVQSIRLVHLYYQNNLPGCWNIYKSWHIFPIFLMKILVFCLF